MIQDKPYVEIDLDTMITEKSEMASIQADLKNSEQDIESAINSLNEVNEQKPERKKRGRPPKSKTGQATDKKIVEGFGNLFDQSISEINSESEKEGESKQVEVYKEEDSPSDLKMYAKHYITMLNMAIPRIMKVAAKFNLLGEDIKTKSVEDLSLTNSEKKELAEMCSDFAKEEIESVGGKKITFYFCLIMAYAEKV